MQPQYRLAAIKRLIARLTATVHRLIPIIAAGLIFGIIIPGIAAFIFVKGIPSLIQLFSISLPPIFENLAKIAPLLYYRPEAFVYLGKIHSSPVMLFVIFWIWTTVMTAITWFGLKGVEVYSKNKPAGILSQSFTFIQKLMERSVKKWGKYVVFPLFMLPLPTPIMGIDTLAVITAKLLNIKSGFWIFIVLNAVKGLIYLRLPMIPIVENLFK